jgi:hypothetical protein
MLGIITPLLALAIGFAAGYVVRDLKSRRRRAAARAEHFRKQNEKHYELDSEANAWRLIG